MTNEDQVLLRSVPFELERDDSDGDSGSFTGYAAVFDTPTRIDSWEGKFDESISKGAFKKTIRERTPVLQFDHGTHPMVGSIPIGRISRMEEDERGLLVSGDLADNWLVAPVRDAIREGAINGMSFRFTVIKDKWDHTTEVPTRDLKEIRMHELGPVVFPAYETTEIDIRSTILPLLKDEATRADLARLLLFADGADEDDTPDDPDKPLLHLSDLQMRAAKRMLSRLERN